MAKAREFAEANQFEVLYLVETKLVPVLDTTIKEQLEILIDASLQRSKLDLETTSTKVILFIRYYRTVYLFGPIQIYFIMEEYFSGNVLQ